MKITGIALKRPVAMVVLAAAVFVIGLFSLKQMDVDYLPDITYPMIKVHIWWRGATPEDIENNIAEPLESVLATVDNLDYLESSSVEGMYTLLVNFNYGVDVEEAYQDVTTAMGRVARNLPKDMDPPVIIKADPSQLPVIQVALYSDSRDLVSLREWADNWLSDRLTAVQGTAGVEIVGGLEREIRIHLDPGRMQAYNLSPKEITRVLGRENIQMFAGRVTVENKEFIARTMGEYESVPQIENIVVARGAGGQAIYVRDIATVEDSHEDERVITRFNGRPCVKLNVLKQAEANTVSVSGAVKKRFDELGNDIPGDIQVGFVENQGDYVMGAINSVRDSAILAGILVIFVVYFFLGQWRQVVVMATALPLTLLANFFIMKNAGFSINLFSLGGLVVALGVILDNSIVVLENITRLKSEGAPDSALRGTTEVGGAIIASTLTFLAIFLPFLIVPGLASLLFRELVLVIAGIVVISLLVAVTVTPFLTDRLTKNENTGRISLVGRMTGAMINAMTAVYTRALGAAMKFRWVAVLLVIVVFLVSLFVAGRIGSEFLPKVDDGRVMVKVMMPSGTSVRVVDRILKQAEEKLEGIPEIESVFTLSGGKVWGLATYEIANEGELNIQLVPKSKRKISTGEFIEKIKPIVGKIPAPGGKIAVMQMKVKGIRKVGTQEVEVKISGSEIKPIFEHAKSIAETLNGTPGLANVNISMDMTKPEYRIFIDRARASELGVSVEEAATTLRNLVQGGIATRYREGSEYYDVRVIIPETRITSRTDIEDLVIENNRGMPVYLKDIARVERAAGPVEIVRENQAKQVIVRADSAGVSVGEATSRAERAVQSVERPGGIEIEMGGQAQLMKENRQVMLTVIGFALFFAFVILAIQFESYILPILIIMNVPLALAGSFFALALAGKPIGITVMIGLVVMMGGITSQGVVLVSMAEDMARTGLPPVKAMAMAAPLRLRPILMTQLTTVLGLVPLALNLGEGGDMLQPMAIAVIGGLLYSLVLTLLFLPAAYSITRRVRRDSIQQENDSSIIDGNNISTGGDKHD